MACKHCRKVMAHPDRNDQKTTTSMSRHLKSCKKYISAQSAVRHRIGEVPAFFATQNALRNTLTKEIIDEQILKFFISGNIPFNQADNEHFWKLISWIEVNRGPASCPSRKVIRVRLTNHAVHGKEDLKYTLSVNKSKISLALDCWTTRTNFGFLGMCPNLALSLTYHVTDHL